MHRRPSSLAVIALLALLASLAIAIPAGAGAASSRTRWVDDDGRAGPGGCGGARHAARSIQAAVNASGPGDTILVCPGVYVEQVRIRGDRDGLTLKAVRPFEAQIKAPPNVAAPLGFHYLVLIERVDDVTLQGFRIVTRTSAPCDSLEVTVGAVGSRGTSIRGNRLQAPGSAGGVCFQNIGIAVVDSLANGQPGGGSSGFTASATIAANEVRDAVFAAIISIAQTGRVRLDVAGNTVRAWFGAPPAGEAPSVTGPMSQFGIGLLGRSAGTVRNNVVQGAYGAPESAPGFIYGIVVAPSFITGAPAANGSIVIRGNLVRRVAFGLWLAGARGVKVRGNLFRHVAFGMGLDGARESRLANNQVQALQAGIIAANGAQDNRIVGNVVTGPNGTCSDDTSGGNTAGTANHWSGNSANHGSSPAAICPQG
jgi:hypothetical protein